MSAISISPSQSAREATESFANYLDETGNTICGRHPIGVLLAALAKIEQGNSEAVGELRWIRYAQSSEVMAWEESSVSYAAGIVVRGK